MAATNQASIYRLNTILTLFQANRACYSVSDIAEILDIPAAVVRKDIIMLHTNKECGITFFAEEASGNFEDADGFDESDDSMDLVKFLADGKNDDCLLMAETNVKNDVFLSLSQFELSCLDDFLDGQNYAKGKMNKNYVTKPLFNQARANMQIKVAELNKLVEQDACIKVQYRTRNKTVITSLIKPLGLVHNAMDDFYYVVTIKEGKLVSLRLDRIRSYEISEEKIVIDDLSPLELIPQIWGMEVGEPVHVKIKILNEARVQEKVKRDLASRTKGVWSQKGDALYFEDDVIGINNFRTWINGYGSSVLVVEPAFLREQIVESAKKRVDYYK